MQRRIASAALLFLVCANPQPSFAQGSRFKPIEYSAIAEDSRIQEGMATMVAESVKQIYVPPLFRYRLKLTTTGAVRELHEPRLSAIQAWGRSLRDGTSFVKVFTHEIEVESQGVKFWLPWQSSLVSPFREELGSGGNLTVNVLLAGAIPTELLLVAVSFISA
jgi:hypothetical protein